MTWGNQNTEAEGHAQMDLAFEKGINFFDTAEMYGDGYSEKLLAKALGDKRKEAVILSKVKPESLSKNDLNAACERIDFFIKNWFG